MNSVALNQNNLPTKMFKLVVFLLSICFVVAENPLGLTPLCDERITVDGIHKVNSYYRMKFTKSIKPIGEYMPNVTRVYGYGYRYRSDDDDYPEFNSITLDFNKQFKKQLKEIYTEKFMNSSQLAYKIREKQALLLYIQESFRSFYDSYHGVPSAVKKNLDDLRSLLSNINNLTENHLTLTFLPYNQLRTDLELLARDGLNENQVSIFQDEFIDVFYEKQLASFDGFKLYRGNQMIFWDELSYGEAYFSLFVPFFDRNQSPNQSNCSSTHNLPMFFSLETVPVEKNRAQIAVS